MRRYSAEDLHLAALAELPGVGPFRLPDLVELFGSGTAAWEAGPAAMAAALAFEDEERERLVRSFQRDRPEVLAGELEGLGVDLLGPDRLPGRLRLIEDRPALLFVRGSLPPDGWPALAVVGTRRSDYSGLVLARRIASEVASAGAAVVSGLARGVDGAAHEAALGAGGFTVAVLGCGVDVVYPPEHRRLYQEIAAAGAVVSEFPPGTPPRAGHFPWRNRLISGLSDGVVVVRAGLRSGAMITAEYADRQGRLLFACPGEPLRPCTAGSNFLLTHPEVVAVLTGYEVLPWLPGFGLGEGWRARARAGRPAGPDLSRGDGGDAAKLLDALRGEPLSFDEVAERVGLDAARLGALLVRLRRAGRVRWLPGMRFVASGGDTYN